MAEVAYKVVFKGEKTRQADKKAKGEAHLTHVLLDGIANAMGGHEFVGYKLILHYITNAGDGSWAPSWTELSNRVNADERTLKDKRKALARIGWLTINEGQQTIEVNFDKIYEDIGHLNKRNKDSVLAWKEPARWGGEADGPSEKTTGKPDGLSEKPIEKPDSSSDFPIEKPDGSSDFPIEKPDGSSDFPIEKPDGSSENPNGNMRQNGDTENLMGRHKFFVSTTTHNNIRDANSGTPSSFASSASPRCFTDEGVPLGLSEPERWTYKDSEEEGYVVDKSGRKEKYDRSSMEEVEGYKGYYIAVFKF